MSNIRQIGDAILHQCPTPVDWSNSAMVKQLKHDIKILEKDLREQAGAGIAANQCAAIANPLQVAIIGSNDETARSLAAIRYPGQVLPYETVLVNPKIITYAGEAYYLQYGEGCLSLAGSLRAKVKRYKEVTVAYQDIEGNAQERTFKDFAAHAVQHECDHLNGIVYLQKILDELSSNELQQLLKQVTIALEVAPEEAAPKPVKPNLVFDRDNDELVFDTENLLKALKSTAKEALLGLKDCLDKKYCCHSREGGNDRGVFL